MQARVIPQLLLALLRHQIKKALGEEALGILAKELTDLGGEELDRRLDVWYGDQSLAVSLERAAKLADECFRTACDDPELAQWMVSMPLAGLPHLRSAIAELPDQTDVNALEHALKESIARDWHMLREDQIAQAVDAYLRCIRRSLLPVQSQTLLIIGRSVLRTEDEVRTLREDIRTWMKRFETQLLSARFLGRARKGSVFLAPPKPVHELVGREGLLQELKQRLFSGDSVGSSALYGLPGVGKSAMAAFLAHDNEVRDHFEDGVLWAGVGRDPDVLTLLAKWGTALTISSDELGKLTTVEAMLDRMQAAIGDRRMLLVIDDVWRLEAGLSFKLGGPNCAHLLTTRLPGIAFRFAGEGASVVHELNEADGLKLLGQIAPEVVESQPEEAEELVHAVGALPLALVLIGHFLKARAYGGQPRRISAALDRLRDIQARLQLAEPQPPRERHPSLPESAWVSLEAVIAISYEALDTDTQSALGALSIFPSKPNSYSEEAALVVMDAPIDTLDTLSDQGLLENAGPGRYMLHQTVSDYAGLKLSDDKPFKRLAEYYVRFLEERDRDYHELDAEIMNVLAALEVAFDKKMPSYIVRGVNALYPYLDARGLYSVARLHLQRTLQFPEITADAVLLITSLLNLGRALRHLGEFGTAEEHLLEAFRLADQVGYRESVPDILLNLGGAAVSRGDYETAEGYYKQGLDLAHELGAAGKVSAILANWGTAAYNIGDLDRAEEYYEKGLALALEQGDSQRIGDMLMGLGAVADSRGQYPRAEKFYHRALNMASEIGRYERMCVLLSNLGGIAEVQGAHKTAEMYLEQGLELARDIGHRENTSLLLMTLGEVKYNRGDNSEAERLYKEGLGLAKQIGQRKRISALLLNLGILEMDRGNYPLAKVYLSEALALAREIKQRWLICSTLVHLGELYLIQGSLRPSSGAFSESLGIAQDLALKEFIGLSKYGLAKIAVRDGDLQEARREGQDSLAMLESIGHEKAVEVRQWLTTVSSVSQLEVKWWNRMRLRHKLMFGISVPLLIGATVDLVLGLLGLPSLWHWFADIVLLAAAFGLIGTAMLLAVDSTDKRRLSNESSQDLAEDI